MIGNISTKIERFGIHSLYFPHHFVFYWQNNACYGVLDYLSRHIKEGCPTKPPRAAA